MPFDAIFFGRSTTKGYPLKIEATQVVVEESPMDSDLVKKTLAKLEYSAVVTALQEIADATDPKPPEIPTELPADGGEIESSVLEALYHVLFNIHVIEGDLICPDTGRRFPIKQGIPNMVLHEDEI
jgi:multifunctional methyltransferase subunit TRM112